MRSAVVCLIYLKMLSVSACCENGNSREGKVSIVRKIEMLKLKFTCKKCILKTCICHYSGRYPCVPSGNVEQGTYSLEHDSDDGAHGESNVEVESLENGEQSDDKMNPSGRPLGIHAVSENSLFHLQMPFSPEKMPMGYKMGKWKNLLRTLYQIRIRLKRLSLRHAMQMGKTKKDLADQNYFLRPARMVKMLMNCFGKPFSVFLICTHYLEVSPSPLQTQVTKRKQIPKSVKHYGQHEIEAMPENLNVEIGTVPITRQEDSEDETASDHI